jgi:hypothetical protein
MAVPRGPELASNDSCRHLCKSVCGSFDNSYEIAQFPAGGGETYTIIIRRCPAPMTSGTGLPGTP